MPAFRDGTANILGLTNPGVYVDIIPPSPFLVGSPTNIEGLVGVGSWGPVDAPMAFSTPDGCAGIFGVAQQRSHDIATHVLAAYQQGGQIGFMGVRVTDGTDTAATVDVPSNGGSFTAKFTGALGNQITTVFQPTAAVGAFAAIVNFPGRTPERFDNVYQGLQSLAVTPGTGYTAVPSIILSAPQKAGSVQATAQASLVAVGIPTVAVSGGGTGHVVNDVITLGAGVKVKVATANAGAILTVTLENPGSITSGPVPATVGAQTASTGIGTGANFVVGFGLGPATFTAGSGYTAAPTLTLMGGGGIGGAYAPAVSFWAALATAINNGNAQRGSSDYVIFSPGTSTAVPSLNTPLTFSGGTDGAAGVTSATLVGQDTSPRSGMFALRNSQVDCFALCDLVDPTTWAAQLAFAIEETTLAVVTTAPGDTIAGCIATRQSEGIDDTNIWIIEGDWPTFFDTQNGLSRLVSPQAIAIGLAGNLSPEQSPINKGLIAVTATQTSQTGVLISSADESAAQTGGIDLIGKSSDLNEDFFSFLTGRNASSNTAANGIEYTRLTNFIVRSLLGSATRAIVGRLQSSRADDPTRALALATLNSFFAALVDPNSGSGGYGVIDNFSVVCDLTNNSEATIIRGLLFAKCTVRYLNVVRIFVVQLAGGGNVNVTIQGA